MDNIYTKVRSLSTPAIIYLVIALFFVLGGLFDGVYCYARSKACNLEETILKTVYLLLFTIIWTWILNTLYSRGYHKTAWVMLIFFPGFYI